MNSSVMQNENEEARQSMERKRKQPSEEVDDGAGSPDQVLQKKPRFIWTADVHNKFLDAVRELGYTKAVPTKILTLMKVKGLTRENVASHLQKFRLHTRKKHREMHGGCARPDESRKSRSSVTRGISGNSRRSCVVPNTMAMKARGPCSCYVLPQPVTSLSNQFGVYPNFQGISYTPSKDMLSENSVQGIGGGGLEDGFYDSNRLYDYNGLAINGPLTPNPLVDSYGYSFLPQLDDLSIANQGVSSPSVDQNMENFGGVVHSPRVLGGGVEHFPGHGGLGGGVEHFPGHGGLGGGVEHFPGHGGLGGGVEHFPGHGGLGGGVEHFPGHGGLDGRVEHFPGHGGFDGELVHLPRPGGLDRRLVDLLGHGRLEGGMAHSPRFGGLDGGLVDLLRHGGLDGGLVHSLRPCKLEGGLVQPPRPDGLEGGVVHPPRPVEVPGHAVGHAYYPAESPVLAGDVQCPVEVPELDGGTANLAVDARVPTGGDTTRQDNPIFDADEEFLSFDDNWMNFVQDDLQDTGIDDLFR